MSQCCCIEVDYCESDFSKTKLVKARKGHKCVECHEIIKIGSLHEVVSGRWDTEMSRFRTCARCANVRDEYFSCGWYIGNMVEDFKECFGFDYTKGIPKDFAPCKGKKPVSNP